MKFDTRLEQWYPDDENYDEDEEVLLCECCGDVINKDKTYYADSNKNFYCEVSCILSALNVEVL